MAQLHLLRRFVGWDEAATVDEAEAWVKRLREEDPGGAFASYTSRCPRRTDELKGGSVYFCRNRIIEFRMPFLRMEPDGDGWAIVMDMDFIRVEPVKVKFLRGWRYLKASEAPADVGMPAEMPGDMDERLREMGVVM